MTKLKSDLIWREPFSESEIKKIPTEKERGFSVLAEAMKKAHIEKNENQRNFYEGDKL